MLYEVITVWVGSSSGQWVSGYDFMGLAPYQTTDLTWVTADKTYQDLFKKTRQTVDDPEILLASGIYYPPGYVDEDLGLDYPDGYLDTSTLTWYRNNFV